MKAGSESTMNMLTNKHVIIAMIVAPILAIIAYFGIDAMVSETPHAARQGAQYELIEKPNCRYNSGVCGLKNGDFELKLTVDWTGGSRANLNLQSIFPLQGVRLALVAADRSESQPLSMERMDERGLQWRLQLPGLEPGGSRLRLAVVSNETWYYGDVSTSFSVYETSFGEDFRKPKD